MHYTLAAFQSSQLLSASKLNEPNAAAAAFLAQSQSLASACWLIRELRRRRRRQMGQKLLFICMWWISRVNNQRHALIKVSVSGSFPLSLCVCLFELHTYLSHVGVYERIYNCCGCILLTSEVATCSRYQLQCPIQWVSGALKRLLFDRSLIVVDLLICTELWRPFKLGLLNLFCCILW